MFVTQLEGSVGILSHIQGVYQQLSLSSVIPASMTGSCGRLHICPNVSAWCAGVTARLRQVRALSAHLCVVRDFGFAALGLFFPHTRARTHLEPAPWKKKNPDLHLSSDQIICIFLMETVKKKNKKNIWPSALTLSVLTSRLCSPGFAGH